MTACPKCGHVDASPECDATVSDVAGAFPYEARCSCDCRYEIEHAARVEAERERDEALDELARLARKYWQTTKPGSGVYAAKVDPVAALLTRHGRMREVEPGRFCFVGEEG